LSFGEYLPSVIQAYYTIPGEPLVLIQKPTLHCTGEFVLATLDPTNETRLLSKNEIISRSLSKHPLKNVPNTINNRFNSESLMKNMIKNSSFNKNIDTTLFENLKSIQSTEPHYFTSDQEDTVQPTQNLKKVKRWNSSTASK
jgi:hypothetical protein